MKFKEILNLIKIKLKPNVLYFKIDNDGLIKVKKKWFLFCVESDEIKRMMKKIPFDIICGDIITYGKKIIYSADNLYLFHSEYNYFMVNKEYREYVFVAKNINEKSLVKFISFLMKRNEYDIILFLIKYYHPILKNCMEEIKL